jgi:hypothetical protein
MFPSRLSFLHKPHIGKMSALRNLKNRCNSLVSQLRIVSPSTFKIQNLKYVYSISANYSSLPPTQSLPKKSKDYGKKGPMSWKTFLATAGVGGALLAFMLYVRKEKEIGNYFY